MRTALATFGMIALALVAVRPAEAGDPPAAPTFEASLDKAHALVTAEKWDAAATALRKLFTDFQGDARVRSHLREIEDDLKLSLFRQAQGPVKGTDLFGDAAVKFVPATRDVELSFSGLRGPLWQTTEDRLSFLDVRFEGSLTLDADVGYLDGDDKTMAVLLCYDIEKRGGYVVSPGYFLSDRTSILRAPAGVRKVAKERAVDLTNKVTGGESAANYRGDLTVSRSYGEIVVKVGGTPVARSSDSAFTSGYVGFIGGIVRSVRLKGRIDRHAYRKLLAEHFDGRFAEWQAKVWNREKEVPSWAGDLPIVVPDSTLFEVPSDTRRTERDEVAGLASEAADGELGAIVLATARAAQSPPNTSLYLGAAAALGAGAWKSAADTLDRLVAAEPALAPARLLRGRAFVRLRRLDDSLADFRWVTKERPACGEAWAEIAKLEIFRGDLAAAGAALQEAAERGAGGEDMDLVLDWVHRARRGPRFAQRFEFASAHFVVVSDHSQKICTDTAGQLETMQAQYAAAIGTVPPRAAKSRVYVFSGIDGYLDYADDLMVPADQTAGVYLPMLQELVLWIPIDMTSFTDTVRHEGFHQYLHRFVESSPTWFNEGYAEVMGGGGPEGLRNAGRDGEFVQQFVPVKELVGLDHAAFMLNAGVHYTEARYLIDFLRRTSHPKLKTVLKDYFAALVAGLSQDEANEKVLAPVADVLEAAFRESLKR